MSQPSLLKATLSLHLDKIRKPNFERCLRANLASVETKLRRLAEQWYEDGKRDSAS